MSKKKKKMFLLKSFLLSFTHISTKYACFDEKNIAVFYFYQCYKENRFFNLLAKNKINSMLRKCTYGLSHSHVGRFTENFHQAGTKKR